MTSFSPISSLKNHWIPTLNSRDETSDHHPDRPGRFGPTRGPPTCGTRPSVRQGERGPATGQRGTVRLPRAPPARPRDRVQGERAPAEETRGGQLVSGVRAVDGWRRFSREGENHIGRFFLLWRGLSGQFSMGNVRILGIFGVRCDFERFSVKKNSIW